MQVTAWSILVRDLDGPCGCRGRVMVNVTTFVLGSGCCWLNLTNQSSKGYPEHQ